MGTKEGYFDNKRKTPTYFAPLASPHPIFFLIFPTPPPPLEWCGRMSFLPPEAAMSEAKSGSRSEW